METHNPLDILRSLFELLSFVDFHRAKMVCSSWYSVSKQTVPRESGSPWLLLFPEDCTDCVLYNPYEEVMVYRRAAGIDYCPGSRFLASCGKWFLMLDSRSRLYIIHVFSTGNRIDLPLLESLLSNDSALKRMEDRDREFEWELTSGSVYLLYADEIRGRFYKKGNAHYDLIRITYGIPRMLTGLLRLVLRGYRLYILTTRSFVRVIDFSRQQGFEELTRSDTYPSPAFAPLGYDCYFSIAVTTAGEVLLVTRSTTSESSERAFRIYKMDPNADPDDHMPDLLDVDSLGDEALLLDLGITVPANNTLGIKQNSIYFTHHNLICSKTNWNKVAHVLPPNEVDICVFNLSTKTLEPFPAPSSMSLKGARWIFSMI
ncbi:PREDICTED: F-box protein At2g14290-like [Camelina sativa]|uniref:F-box protein At2g14290-like n=1 Tax=Camelina sativa TaxID=90675 RepID=A0ABM0WBB4_CAMSA|nr:PREDICTED: F-box protein At2g14290-like [Camelina sativa]